MLTAIAFPFLAGLVCLLLPKRFDKERAVIAVVSAAMTLLLVWPLFTGGRQFLDLGMKVCLRVDGLSSFILPNP